MYTISQATPLVVEKRRISLQYRYRDSRGRVIIVLVVGNRNRKLVVVSGACGRSCKDLKSTARAKLKTRTGTCHVTPFRPLPSFITFVRRTCWRRYPCFRVWILEVQQPEFNSSTSVYLYTLRMVYMRCNSCCTDCVPRRSVCIAYLVTADISAYSNCVVSQLVLFVVRQCCSTPHKASLSIAGPARPVTMPDIRRCCKEISFTRLNDHEYSPFWVMSYVCPDNLPASLFA